MQLHKEAGSADLSRSSIYSKQFSGRKDPWVGAMVDIFCTHSQHLHLDLRKPLPSILKSLTWGGGGLPPPWG